MSIHLIFSNSSERLAEKLAEALHPDQNDPHRDPFLPAVVLVPNYNLKKWLQMQIAHLNHVTFNIQFDYLENGLFKILKQFDTRPSGALRLLDRRTLQLMILSWLRSQDFNYQGFAPFKEYLFEQHSGQAKVNGETGRARKIWQLAEKMAGLIIEYEYHRRLMVGKWRKNESHTRAENDSEMEFCQRVLYHGLFGRGNLRDQLGPAGVDRFMTLPQYTDHLFQRSVFKTNPEKHAATSIHIFGHSHLSTFHRDLFLKIGNRQHLKIYQMNACAEFWEDVSTPYEDRQTIKWQKVREIDLTGDESGENLKDNEFENDLLKAWGKPGREALKIYSALEELCAGSVEFHTEWLAGDRQKSDAHSGGVLATVQEHILFRMSGNRDLSQDRTLQIAACPGIYREIETVYNNIVKNMNDDAMGHLKLTDIAVLVPNMEVYKPVLISVFEKGGLVPYNLVDSNASEESVFGQAVLSLLSLAAGDFTRKEVFDLVLNPCFLKGTEMERGEAMQWLTWADRLNIYRNFQSFPFFKGQTGGGDPFTWSQGLQRLRLGRIMEGSGHEIGDGSGGRLFSSYKGTVPYSDNESQDVGRVGKFSLVIEILFHETSQYRDARLSCRQWRGKIEKLVDMFLGIPDDRSEELSIKKKLFAALKDLDILDALLPSQERARPLQLPDVVEVIKSCLEDIPSRRGKYLSGGVTIASLQPMRPIPFKVVYIVGLGEGEFPGKPDKSTLDLRKQKGNRKIGDVNRFEADGYLFLETLICAREKLYLTYVAKNLEKDQTLYPGSIIKQVVVYLNKYVLSSDYQFIEIPLKGSSTKYLARQPLFTDLLFNSSISDRLLSLMSIAKRDRFLDDRLKKDIQTIAAEHTPDFRFPEESVQENQENQTVKLSELALFLKNPAEAAIRRHMMLYEDETKDAALMEDEPLYAVFPRAWQIPVDILSHAVQNRADQKLVLDYSRDYYDYYQSCSELPSGAFAEVDFDRFHSGIIDRFFGERDEDNSINRLLVALEGRSKKMINGVALGENTLNSPCERICDPAVVALDLKDSGKRELQIHGAQPFVWENREGIFTDCLVIINSSVQKDLPKQVLAPFLFYVASAVIGKVVEQCEFFIHIAHKKGVRSYQYQGLSRAGAAAYLNCLLNDFIVTASPDLLPWEIIVKEKESFESILAHDELPLHVKERQYQDRLVNALEARADSAWTVYHQPELLDLINVKVPDDAIHKVARRLKPVFNYKKV